MLVNLSLSVALVLACVFIHYEVLRFTSGLIGRLTIPPRPRVLVVMAAVFLAHTLEIWLYAIAYYLLAEYLGIGGLAGTLEHRFNDYLYFSTSTYSSLGYGDIFPVGGLRMMAGIETVDRTVVDRLVSLIHLSGHGEILGVARPALPLNASHSRLDMSG